MFCYPPEVYFVISTHLAKNRARLGRADQELVDDTLRDIRQITSAYRPQYRHGRPEGRLQVGGVPPVTVEPEVRKARSEPKHDGDLGMPLPAEVQIGAREGW